MTQNLERLIGGEDKHQRISNGFETETQHLQLSLSQKVTETKII